MELPRYEVLRRTFIAPHRLEPGSIISFTGEPGDHFLPLNDPAKAAMEKWYDKEVNTFDLDGKPIKIQPNLSKRPRAPDQMIKEDTVVLHSIAPPETAAVAVGMDRPLQPDLPIVPLEGSAVSAEPLESFDGTLAVESTPADVPPGSASVPPPSAKK